MMMKPQQKFLYTQSYPLDKKYIPAQDLGDLRFRSLLSAEEWQQLPSAVRARFSKRLYGTKAAVYTGEIMITRMSRLGWALAQIARIIGGPLPTSRDEEVPAVVSVTEDEKASGQYWTRVYGRRGSFPQVIHSSKRFAGPTGLEEYVGSGIGMALKISADATGLHFTSAHYFLKIAKWKLKIPHMLNPGTTTVSHIDMGHGAFAFILEVIHPWFGELIYQAAYFKDA
jgi:Domain of unknown function (DUF4166)